MRHGDEDNPSGADGQGPALPAVVVVAHGSAVSGEAAVPTLALAQALRARGFGRVVAGFWKEEPFLHRVLALAGTPEVVVVPLFLAEGWFTRVVVPGELEAGRVGAPGVDRVRLLPPVGSDPAMATLVLERAAAALPPGAGASATTLVVLGHGSERHAASGDRVLALARELDGRGPFARTVPAFIDQDPRLEDVVAGLGGGPALVVPFLVAAGWHGGTTVPRELAAGGGGEQIVTYAEPVGTHPGLADVVAASLRRALGGAAEEGAGGSRPPAAPPLPGPLRSALGRAGSVTLLEVRVEAVEGGGYALRHRDDAGAEPSTLTPLVGNDALRALARRDRNGAHRPLRSARGLPRGWRAAAPDDLTLEAALEALCGSASADLGLAPGGSAVRSFREAAGRHRGAYGGLADAPASEVLGAVERCCRGLPCLRVPLWGVEGDVPPAPAEEGGGGLPVPCPEPCPLFLSALLEGLGDAGAGPLEEGKAG